MREAPLETDQMNRRRFLKSAAAIPILPICGSQILTTSAKGAAPSPPARRVRPADPAWPSAASWDRLKREVGGRLAKVQSPVIACQNAPTSAACSELFSKLK